jgi:hypothetical protein
MASLPIGSNKILEVHTKSVSLVIKSKKTQAFVDESLVMSQNSSIDITTATLEKVKIDCYNIEKTYENTIVITPGTHEVKVTHDGKEVYTHKVFVSTGESKVIEL